MHNATGKLQFNMALSNNAKFYCFDKPIIASEQRPYLCIAALNNKVHY